jgi:hypothetical protein
MRRVFPELIVLGVALLLVACGTAPSQNANEAAASTPQPVIDSAAGLSRCNAWNQNRGNFQLEAAYDSTAGIVAAWWEKLAGGTSTGLRSTWRQYPASLVVTVCYFHGDWHAPGPRPPTIAINRGIIFVGANGVIDQGPVGNDQRLSLVRPSS